MIGNAFSLSNLHSPSCSQKNSTKDCQALANMILWCKFMNSHKDQTSPQHTQTLGSASAWSSSSGSVPLLFLMSLQGLSSNAFPKTYRSSNCKPSFITSAVPALVRGPLSQWWLGFFIFCWRQTYLMQTVISAREGEFCLCLALLHSGFQNREFKLLSRTGSFYFLRERLPCWPFRDQRLKSPISSYPTGRKTSYQFFKICFP